MFFALISWRIALKYPSFLNELMKQIPFLSFPQSEIVEIIPGAYQSRIKRIRIDGVAP